MKKKLAVLLTAALAAASLTACGGSSSSGSSDTSAADTNTSQSAQSDGGSSDSSSLVMAWWGNQTRNERTQKILDMYSEEILVLPLTDSSPNSTTTGTNWQPQQQDIPCQTSFRWTTNIYSSM